VGVDPDAVYALYLVEAFGRRLKAEVKYPPTVEGLKKLAKLYKVVNKSFYYLIMDEISHIERGLGVLGGWMPMHYLYSMDIEKKGRHTHYNSPRKPTKGAGSGKLIKTA
jgi:hypothetical protein